MSLTPEDLKNATKYIAERKRLECIKLLYNKYPHIISWLDYKVVQADKKLDYNYPDSFKHRAIAVKIEISQKMCEEKLSCVPFTGAIANKGMCGVNDETSYYRIGEPKIVNSIDKSLGIRCQPSCYHLKKRDNPDDAKLHSLPLKYNPETKQCAFVSAALLAFMEFPYFRSKTIYEHRVNDLPTGFNRSDTIFRGSVSGLQYEYNKTYCNSFFDKFDGQKKNCYTPWYDVIGNAIVGSYIIKLCKSAHQRSINNDSDLPIANFGKLPEIDPVFKLKNWFKDIRKEFHVPNVDMDVPNSETELGNKELASLISESLVIDNEISREDERTLRIRRSLKDEPMIPDISESNFHKFLNWLISQVMDPHLWETIGILEATTTLGKMLKDLAVYMMKDLTPKIMMSVLKDGVMDKIFGDMLKGVIREMANTLITKMAIELSLKVVAIINPITAALEIVMILTQVMDILLSVFDPLNFNKKYPEGFLDDLLISSEFELKKGFKTDNPVMTFDFLAAMLLTKKETGDLTVRYWEYMAEYVDALAVNSEGQKIDKGEKKKAHKVVDKYVENFKEEMDKVRLYSEEDMNSYETTHMRRMKLIDKIKMLYMSCGAGVVTAMMLNFTVLTYVLIIIVSVLVYCQYLAIGMENIADIEFYFNWIPYK